MHLAILTLTSLFVPPQQQEAQPGTGQRLQAAFEAARAACKDVLGADLDTLPPLKIVGRDELAKVVAAENLPLVRLRQPDEAKAEAEAAVFGEQLASFAYAKYAWSTRSFLVVPATWEASARLLKRPLMTADDTLRAVMVHELCHALDDRKFDIAKRLLEATTTDAVTAFNAVLEGHAQLNTRRVCKVRGWSGGFELFTSSIGAIPEDAGDGEVMKQVLRGTAEAMTMAYVDGERFAAAVLEAKPETGARDIFLSPPKDAETILQPQWYLDPSKRPSVLWDPEPAIDAFVARFDPAVWSSTRLSPTAKQLATGLTLMPKERVDAVLGTLRAIRMVQLAPTAAPQSKMVALIVLEFDSEAAATEWVKFAGDLSDKKDEAMKTGAARITGSKNTRLDTAGMKGLLQEKKMQVGTQAIEVSAIDASRGRVVVESIYSVEPVTAEEHAKVVRETLDAIVRRK